MIKTDLKALALFSGGLDSLLAVLWMQRLGVKVTPVFFATPFFGPQKAQRVAAESNLEMMVVDITDEHLEMLKNPRYGYGKYVNPCIDCHGLMFKKAGQMLEQMGYDFIISGEVLGQRPMSQRKDAMNSVAKLSEIKDRIVRPLSGRLLQPTMPIREGWIKREDLGDIQGRSRKRQMELVEDFGIQVYTAPGGGCMLTDRNFSKRLNDLMENDMLERRFIEFCKIGRHFRISPNTKLIVGKTGPENDDLTALADQELVLKNQTYPGPLGVLNYKDEPSLEDINIAAAIVLRYNNKAPEQAEVSYGRKFELVNSVEVSKLSLAQVETYNVAGRKK